MTLKILPPEGQSLVVAGALISISLHPLSFAAAERVTRRLGRAEVEAPPRSVDADHVIVVGHGRVGSLVAEALGRRAIPYLVIEQDRATTDTLRERGVPVVHGDATRPEVLELASLARARLVVVTTPDPYESRAIVEQARSANPAIEVAARSHSRGERDYLETHGANIALVGAHELALALAEHSLVTMGCTEDRAVDTIDELRRARVREAPA